MATRGQVYAAINEERDYQDNTKGVGTRSVGDELCLLARYVRKAQDDLAQNGKAAALDEVRKIVAMGVRCLEDQGVPRRNDLGVAGPLVGDPDAAESITE